MKLIFGGRCFWCDCNRFCCPACQAELQLRDVEGHLHVGVCPQCGPTADPCRTRAMPEENIFGAIGDPR